METMPRMSSEEFITRANHGPILTAGVHWNPHADHYHRGHIVQRNYACDRGLPVPWMWWHHCAPSGARVSFPGGLPFHGPRVCGLGAYAEQV